VGVFALARNPAIVPDVFLSLDVEVPHDWWQKEHRSYLLWEFGKPPDVVIEIVSNTEGGKQMRNARNTPACASSTTSSMTPCSRSCQMS
jgi:Uma2 family endonuclease